ncbi:hypothetical protein FACS1894200_13080 [Spirochaetia bacterium]|nr:hypothetical protein FACS1894200_13080 [Spirochaetia bacterium]
MTVIPENTAVMQYERLNEPDLTNEEHELIADTVKQYFVLWEKVKNSIHVKNFIFKQMSQLTIGQLNRCV